MLLARLAWARARGRRFSNATFPGTLTKFAGCSVEERVHELPHLVGRHRCHSRPCRGSTALEEIKCTRVETRSLVVTDGNASVSICPSSIELVDKDRGATCLVTSKGVILSNGENPEAGSASLLYLAETGPVLNLMQRSAVASLAASDGTKQEASLRTSYGDNWGTVLAGPNAAGMGALDHGKAAILTGAVCSWNLDPTTVASVGGAAQSKVMGQDDSTVFVTRTGEKFHLSGCQYLRTSKIPMKLSEAVKRFTPCSVCSTGGD
jgi:hypothetical protein